MMASNFAASTRAVERRSIQLLAGGAASDQFATTLLIL
jgi:hypothetical protein